MLGQGACNQAAEHVANDERADAAVGLAQCNEATNPNSGEHGLRELSISKRNGCSVQDC